MYLTTIAKIPAVAVPGCLPFLFPNFPSKLGCSVPPSWRLAPLTIFDPNIQYQNEASFLKISTNLTKHIPPNIPKLKITKQIMREFMVQFQLHRYEQIKDMKISIWSCRRVRLCN